MKEVCRREDTNLSANRIYLHGHIPNEARLLYYGLHINNESQKFVCKYLPMVCTRVKFAETTT